MSHHTVTIHATAAAHPPAGHASSADHVTSLAQKLVDDLKAAGHGVTHSSVIHGEQHELHHT
jgi:hypothetical protein